MKKFITILILTAILTGAWWALRPLLVDDVVEENFPPIITNEVIKNRGEEVLEEHNMTQEEIDAMPEAEKMAMEKKIVEELMEKPATVITEVMPEPTMEKMEKEAETQPPAPRLLSTGNFVGADSFHKGSGQAKIWGQPDGSHFLRFENFSVTNGPDLRVYLADTQNPGKAQVAASLELAPLKGNQGSQNYILPAGVNPADYSSVVIYCKPFKVIFATANLDYSPQ